MADTNEGIGCLQYFGPGALPPAYYVEDKSPLFQFLSENCKAEEKKNADAVKKDGMEAIISRSGECTDFIIVAKKF